MTEARKSDLISEFETEIKQFERELEQLTFQLYKSTKDVQNKQDQQLIRTRYKEEISKRKEKLQLLSFKVQQLHKIEIGTEMRTGTAESMIDVKVGDPWPADTDKTEIIIHNGIVQEIRESRNKHD